MIARASRRQSRGSPGSGPTAIRSKQGARDAVGAVLGQDSLAQTRTPTRYLVENAKSISKQEESGNYCQAVLKMVVTMVFGVCIISPSATFWNVESEFRDEATFRARRGRGVTQTRF
jgi:hypothetical protein